MFPLICLQFEHFISYYMVGYTTYYVNYYNYVVKYFKYIYVIMSGRNRCWQYNNTQNDRGPFYLNYSLLTIKTKNHT